MSRISHQLTARDKSYSYRIARADGGLGDGCPEDVLRQYFRFLRQASLGMVRTVRSRDGDVRMRAVRVTLLRLRPAAVAGPRGEWAIAGGLLAVRGGGGSLVVRAAPGIRSLDFEAFRPRLAALPLAGPLLYRAAQVPLHLLLSVLFLKSLPAATGRRSAPQSTGQSDR